MFTVLHLADIHIGSSPDRVDEYKIIFDKLGAYVQMHTPTYIVIAGDVFHHKDRYSADDVKLFNYLIEQLSCIATKIVIVPGNHDCSMLTTHAGRARDLIEPLASSIIYARETGPIPNTPFYNIAVDDPRTIQPDEVTDKIVIAHGFVDGAVFGKHTVSGSKFPRSTLASATAFLLGDIHEYQAYGTTVYPGSLIQQNISESLCHGVVLWNFQPDTLPTHQFHEIPNESGFLKIDLRGVNDAAAHLTGIKAPSKLLKVSLITDADPAQAQAQIAQAQAKYGQVDKITQRSIVVDPSADIIDALRETLRTKQVAPELIDDILAQHQQGLTSHHPSHWYVTSLRWDNMYRYGTGNCIDFTQLNGGTSGAIAPNRAGKSSIIDILVYALWGEYIRGDKKTMIRRGATNSSIRCEFVHSDTMYFIERNESTTKLNKLTFGSVVDGNETNLSEPTADATYKKIKQLIGPLAQFQATGLYNDPSHDLAQMGKADRMRMLPALFGHVDQTPCLDVLKQQKKQLQLEYNNLPKLVDVSMLPKFEEALKIVTDKLAAAPPTCVPTRPIAMIEQELTKSKQSLVTLQSAAQPRMPAPPQGVPASPAERMCAIALTQRDTAAIESQIASLPQHTPATPEHILTQRIREPIPALTDRTAQANRALAQARDRANLAFADTCAQCNHNKNILARDLVDAEKAVQAAQAHDNASAQAHASASESREQACMDLDAYKRIKLQAELTTLAASIAQASTVLQNDKLAHTYAEYERNEKIHQAIATHTALIATLEQELATARQNQHAYALAAEVPELNRKLGVLQTKIADLQSMQAQNQSRLLLEPPLVAAIKRNQAYIDALSDPTLKMRLVTKSANMLAQAANDILAQITDFTICAQTDTNSVEFVIKENSPNLFTYPISISSGFQKFITSIALRLALVMIIPQKCEMIFVDEGFSVLDTQNMAKLPSLLSSIAPMFRFLFIISHVPELHNALTFPLHIKNVDSPHGQMSYICNVTTTKQNTTIRGMQPCFRASPATPTANHAVACATATHDLTHKGHAVDQAVAAALMHVATAPMPAPNASSTQTDSVTCECGATVKKASLTAHKKTAKHLKLIPAK